MVTRITKITRMARITKISTSYGGAKTAERVISTEWERSLVAVAPSR